MAAGPISGLQSHGIPMQIQPTPYLEILKNQLSHLLKVVTIIRGGLEPICSPYRSLCWKMFSERMAGTILDKYPQFLVYDIVEEKLTCELKDYERKQIEKLKLADSFNDFFIHFESASNEEELLKVINNLSENDIVGAVTTLAVILHCENIEESFPLEFKNTWDTIVLELKNTTVHVFRL